MSSIGPTLPSHLTSKRKRQDENEDESDESAASSTHGSITDEIDIKIKRTRNIGPSLPPPNSTRPNNELDQTSKTSTDESLLAKDLSRNVVQASSGLNSENHRTRTLGPALPLVGLINKGTTAESEDDESDDDFGPVLPEKAISIASISTGRVGEPEPPQPSTKTGRDDWMLAPPASTDWTSKVDPSKMKNRGFTTGKGSRAAPSSGGDMSLWTETPEQKRKRLEDEMLGRKKVDRVDPQISAQARKHAEDAEMARKVQAYNERHRAAPMYASDKADLDEDDPSKRAFDREKDIAGSKLTHAEKKQMMNRAADFGSRFSKGSYL